MPLNKDDYKDIGLEFVPQDPAWVLNSIHKELWKAQDAIRRYEDGEFDYMPEEHREWVGSAQHYRAVLRDVTERIALLKMSPMDRLVDQVTRYQQIHEEYPEDEAESELLYPSGSDYKYVREAYDALNRGDDLAAWTAIVQMNEKVDEQHQPETLYLPNKDFWPELRLKNAFDRMIDMLTATSDKKGLGA